MERVKGIEPSYSAWKAAALPLSYTRAADHLSRHGSRLNRYAAGSELSWPLQRVCSPGAPAGPLTQPDSVPILMFPSTTKGGDPVSYTKRCHLAWIAR